MARASTAWAEEAASEVVLAGLYDVIMCHIQCHTGTGLSQQVTIIEICVWRMYWEVLHALSGMNKHDVGRLLVLLSSEYGQSSDFKG